MTPWGTISKCRTAFGPMGSGDDICQGVAAETGHRGLVCSDCDQASPSCTKGYTCDAPAPPVAAPACGDEGGAVALGWHRLPTTGIPYTKQSAVGANGSAVLAQACTAVDLSDKLAMVTQARRAWAKRCPPHDSAI